eukprot:46340-Hanusia_phi.AAC.4
MLTVAVKRRPKAQGFVVPAPAPRIGSSSPTPVSLVLYPPASLFPAPWFALYPMRSRGLDKA